PYMLLGVIEHTDTQTLAHTLVPFSLIHVLQGRENMMLASGDVVHILTRKEMRAIATVQTQSGQNPTWGSGGSDFIAMPGLTVTQPGQAATTAATTAPTQGADANATPEQGGETSATPGQGTDSAAPAGQTGANSTGAPAGEAESGGEGVGGISQSDIA